MEFSTNISQFDTNYNFNSINEYNKFLNKNASFQFDDTTHTDFEMALENASKSFPIRDKHDSDGVGTFASQMGNAFVTGLNNVNNLRLEADRMQEDIAMGGSTSIHDAMIAAEKASVSLQMAMQVRNRLISAYTDITGMAI